MPRLEIFTGKKGKGENALVDVCFWYKADMTVEETACQSRAVCYIETHLVIGLCSQNK
jgi:hypothetical protein